MDQLDTRSKGNLIASLVALSLIGTGLFAAHAAAETPSCFGREATIVGTNNDDTLRGTDAADVIVGGDGHDEIHGLGGSDLICGGSGSDSIFGGDDDDRLRGNNVGDDLHGGEGNDRLSGDRGGDTLEGGPGDDKLGTRGPGRKDRIVYVGAPQAVTVDLEARTATGDGFDTLIRIKWVLTSVYDDTVTGTKGYDNVFDPGGSDTVTLGEGSDFFQDVPQLDQYPPYEGDVDADEIDLGGGDDQAIADLGADNIHGGPGDDYQLDGGRGDDTIDGGPGSDSIEGGSGTDRCINGEQVVECES